MPSSPKFLWDGPAGLTGQWLQGHPTPHGHSAHVCPSEGVGVSRRKIRRLPTGGSPRMGEGGPELGRSGVRDLQRGSRGDGRAPVTGCRGNTGTACDPSPHTMVGESLEDPEAVPLGTQRSDHHGVLARNTSMKTLYVTDFFFKHFDTHIPIRLWASMT